MASIYVRSTDGNNADNGSTWALAKLDLAGAAAIDASGDFIYLSQNHAESTAGSVSLSFGSTISNCVRILCGNDGAAPPTTAATCTATTTGNTGWTITGSIYVNGITFTAGSGASSTTADIVLGTADCAQYYESCAFVCGTSGTSQRMRVVSNATGTAPCKIVWKNCNVKFGNGSQGMAVGRAGHFYWEGGSLLSGGTSPDTLFLSTGSAGNYSSSAYINGVDLSNASTTMSLVQNGESGRFIFRNCKLPASWSGSPVGGSAASAGQRIELHNCDSASTNYRLWIEDRAGSIKTETTLVRTGGASDGTTTYSWKMATNSAAHYPGLPLESIELSKWNTTTGSAITVTVDVLHDSATALTDGEIWIEVVYLGTSGTPLGTYISDAKSNPLVSSANQASSSATWTTTGMANPNKQQLSVSFTPQKVGYMQARVLLAKASYTVYVDPMLQVS